MNYIEFLKSGQKIKIKKENRGKFTEYCGGKVTQECIDKGKKSSSSKIRKQAVFAENARSWNKDTKKYQTGGYFYDSNRSDLNNESPIELVNFDEMMKKLFNRYNQIEESFKKNIQSDSDWDEINKILSDNNMIPLNQSNKSSSTKYSNLEKFVSDLTNAYKTAGITNEDLLKLLIGQDAFESNWGKNPVGSYNFGNIIVTPSFKGEYEEGLDNGNKRKFRSYNSLLEYVKDKLRILNNTYQITNSDSIDSAISKLMGNNKGKYKYAEAQDYADKLRAMIRSVNKKFK